MAQMAQSQQVSMQPEQQDQRIKRAMVQMLPLVLHANKRAIWRACLYCECIRRTGC
jgi:hypothetical protein